LLYYRFFFFTKDLNENATAIRPVSRRGIPAGRICSAVLVSYLSFGILTWDSFGFPFLVSALSISSLQTFQRTKLSRPPSTLSKRRQKNRSRNLTSCEPQKRCKSTAAAQTGQIFQTKSLKNNV